MTTMATSPDRPKSHGKLALALGRLSISALVVTLILAVLALLINNETFSMETALIFMPILTIIAIAAGLLAVVFSVLTRIRFGHRDPHWLKAMILGIVGAVAMPLIFWALASLS